MIAAVQCAGNGPSQLKEASAAVLERVQQFESVSRLETPVDVPEPMELQWGNIKIDTLLGTGSFSCVYKAQVKALSSMQDNNKGNSSARGQENNMYAIKSLSTETICCNESFVTGAVDLALEAKILSKLHHENVIQIRGVKGGNIAESFANSQAGGGFFLVVDLLETTLDSRLEEWRKAESKAGRSMKNLFSPKKRSQKRLRTISDRLENVVLGVLRGMEYIHSKNIILRDLKPHNIGFDYEGKVRIFDFGLARELTTKGGSNTEKTTRCNTGIAGTLRYISPENALGQPCGLSADVYSFAILLYEVITLQVPFSEIKLVSEFKEKVIRGRHRPNLKFVPGSLLQDTLQDSWHPSPRQRPSFYEIRCLLEEFISKDMLSKESDWRKFNFKLTKPSNRGPGYCCGSYNKSISDSSAGGGSIRRLSGSHGAYKNSHDSVDIKLLQEELKQEERDTSLRTGMAGSFHGGINDQLRSFTENISFNSSKQQVHPL